MNKECRILNNESKLSRDVLALNLLPNCLYHAPTIKVLQEVVDRGLTNRLDYQTNYVVQCGLRQGALTRGVKW